MRTVSDTWKRIFRDRNHLTQVKIVIDGVEYGMDDLYAVTQERTVFSGGSPEVGACCASSLSFDVIPRARVPRMAEVTLYNRLASWDGSETSEWLVMGTYFIDTRAKTDDGMKMRFTAYDSMLKCDQSFAENTTWSDWPADENDLVEDIADIIGVTVDARTVLAGYEVPYADVTDLTMREVLGYIAAANGGNWIITPENKLLLVKLEGDNSLLGRNHSVAIAFGDDLIVLSTGYKYDDGRSLLGPDDTKATGFGNSFVVIDDDNTSSYFPGGTDIHRNAQGFHNLGLLQPFSGVKVWYSRENSYEDIEVEHQGETSTEKVEVENAFTAGDDSGRVLELDCPWATQEMADAILEQIEEYMYQGASVDSAQITPAAELGDVVICDGVGFSLSSINVSYSGDYLPAISAPADEEVDYEYHYETETERKLQRKVTLGDNYYGFRVTRENGIEVTNIVDGVETTRMILNSNLQAFFNANGVPALYFDAEAGEYKFRGNVTITQGSLGLSSKFVIYPPDATEQEIAAFNVTVPDGFSLVSRYNNALRRFLSISQNVVNTVFDSSAGGFAVWQFPITYVYSSPIYFMGEAEFQDEVKFHNEVTFRHEDDTTDSGTPAAVINGNIHFTGQLLSTYSGSANAQLATFDDVYRIVHEIVG